VRPSALALAAASVALALFGADCSLVTSFDGFSGAPTADGPSSSPRLEGCSEAWRTAEERVVTVGTLWKSDFETTPSGMAARLAGYALGALVRAPAS
jgi:hypothetical protein